MKDGEDKDGWERVLVPGIMGTYIDPTWCLIKHIGPSAPKQGTTLVKSKKPAAKSAFETGFTGSVRNSSTAEMGRK